MSFKIDPINLKFLHQESQDVTQKQIDEFDNATRSHFDWLLTLGSSSQAEIQVISSMKTPKQDEAPIVTPSKTFRFNASNARPALASIEVNMENSYTTPSTKRSARAVNRKATVQAKAAQSVVSNEESVEKIYQGNDINRSKDKSREMPSRPPPPTLRNGKDLMPNLPPAPTLRNAKEVIDTLMQQEEPQGKVEEQIEITTKPRGAAGRPRREFKRNTATAAAASTNEETEETSKCAEGKILDSREVIQPDAESSKSVEESTPADMEIDSVKPHSQSSEQDMNTSKDNQQTKPEISNTMDIDRIGDEASITSTATPAASQEDSTSDSVNHSSSNSNKLLEVMTNKRQARAKKGRSRKVEAEEMKQADSAPSTSMETETIVDVQSTSSPTARVSLGGGIDFGVLDSAIFKSFSPRKAPNIESFSSSETNAQDQESESHGEQKAASGAGRRRRGAAAVKLYGAMKEEANTNADEEEQQQSNQKKRKKPTAASAKAAREEESQQLELTTEELDSAQVAMDVATEESSTTKISISVESAEYESSVKPLEDEEMRPPSPKKRFSMENNIQAETGNVMIQDEVTDQSSTVQAIHTNESTIDQKTVHLHETPPKESTSLHDLSSSSSSSTTRIESPSSVIEAEPVLIPLLSSAQSQADEEKTSAKSVAESPSEFAPQENTMILDESPLFSPLEQVSLVTETIQLAESSESVLVSSTVPSPQVSSRHSSSSSLLLSSSHGEHQGPQESMLQSASSIAPSRSASTSVYSLASTHAGSAASKAAAANRLNQKMQKIQENRAELEAKKKVELEEKRLKRIQERRDNVLKRVAESKHSKLTSSVLSNSSNSATVTLPKPQLNMMSAQHQPVLPFSSNPSTEQQPMENVRHHQLTPPSSPSKTSQSDINNSTVSFKKPSPPSLAESATPSTKLKKATPRRFLPGIMNGKDSQEQVAGLSISTSAGKSSASSITPNKGKDFWNVLNPFNLISSLKKKQQQVNITAGISDSPLFVPSSQSRMIEPEPSKDIEHKDKEDQEFVLHSSFASPQKTSGHQTESSTGIASGSSLPLVDTNDESDDSLQNSVPQSTSIVAERHLPSIQSPLGLNINPPPALSKQTLESTYHAKGKGSKPSNEYDSEESDSDGEFDRMLEDDPKDDHRVKKTITTMNIDQISPESSTLGTNKVSKLLPMSPPATVPIHHHTSSQSKSTISHPTTESSPKESTGNAKVKMEAAPNVKTPPKPAVPASVSNQNLRTFLNSPEYQCPIEPVDDEEDEDSGHTRGPTWTLSKHLIPALENQYRIDPDDIFGSDFPTSCDLVEIFPTDKVRIISRPRTSSAAWSKDKLTQEERREYRRRMGFAAKTLAKDQEQ